MFGVFAKQSMDYIKVHVNGTRPSRFAVNLGFTRCLSDYSLFYHPILQILLIIFVDDLLIGGPTTELIEKIIDKFNKRFTLTILGTPKLFIGTDIEYDKEKGSLYIHQRSYINKVLKRFRMDEAKPSSLPMTPNQKLQPATEKDSSIPFRQLIGCLIFLANVARPDIMYAVHRLAQYSQSYSEVHWDAGKKILAYLKSTRDYGIMYSSSEHTLPQLKGYSDASLGYPQPELVPFSTTGFCFTLCNGAVSWSSKKQKEISLSSAEAEYLALCSASREGRWIVQLLQELTILTKDYTMTIFTDSTSAMRFSKNPIEHSRLKHIHLKYHYVRLAIERELLLLKFIATAENPADLFTKALPKVAYQRHRSSLSLQKHSAITPIDES